MTQAQEQGTEGVNFSTFILSLASATFIELGLVEDPHSNKKRLDLKSAKQHIDLLQILQEKTRGNLDDEERGLLERILRDIRLQYVQASGKG
ncbi:MAG: DUF1844 domain-containing protein [Bdellovibrionota bacterium]